MSFTFKRKLLTGDPKDVDINEGENQNLIWAIGNSATFTSHQKDGRANIVLFRTLETQSKQISHGVLMLIAWLGLETVGRMLDTFEGWFGWKHLGFFIHSLIYIVVIVISVVAIIIAITMSQTHFIGYHSIIGYLIILFYSISFGFRVMTHYHKNQRTNENEVLHGIYTVHYWMSNVVYIGSLVQMFMGIFIMNLHFGYFIVLAILYFIIFLLYVSYSFFQPRTTTILVKDEHETDFHEIYITHKFIDNLKSEIADVFHKKVEDIDKINVITSKSEPGATKQIINEVKEEITSTKQLLFIANNTKLVVKWKDHEMKEEKL